MTLCVIDIENVEGRYRTVVEARNVWAVSKCKGETVCVVVAIFWRPSSMVCSVSIRVSRITATAAVTVMMATAAMTATMAPTAVVTTMVRTSSFSFYLSMYFS